MRNLAVANEHTGDYDAALYASSDRVSRDRYLIRIGQNCERSYCPYGIISGTRISKRTRPLRGKVVELAGGIKGRLIDGSVNLKNSTIAWNQGRYRYVISIYARKPADMLKIANSALSCDGQ